MNLPANRRWAVWTLVLGAGCSTTSVDPTQLGIVQDVAPLPPTRLKRICVEVNSGVKSHFTDRLFEVLGELGFQTQSRQSAFGDECRHWLSYSAAWAGFPEYLATADIGVYENRSKLGHVRYDARKSGNRPDRYGPAIGKLRPLLEALFVRVERGGP